MREVKGKIKVILLCNYLKTGAVSYQFAYFSVGFMSFDTIVFSYKINKTETFVVRKLNYKPWVTILEDLSSLSGSSPSLLYVVKAVCS